MDIVEYNVPPWQPLFVGAIVGGGSSQAFDSALMELAEIVGNQPWRPDLDETGVDAVFHVAGPLLTLDYQGLRTGRFSARDRLIAVQIAVPAVVHSQAEPQILVNLSADLLRGVELAAQTMASKRNAKPIVHALSIAAAAWDEANRRIEG